MSVGVVWGVVLLDSHTRGAPAHSNEGEEWGVINWGLDPQTFQITAGEEANVKLADTLQNNNLTEMN